MAITPITVTGTYKRQNGSTNATGTVTFLLNQPLQDTSGTNQIISPVPVVVTLSSGAFSTTLAATNDSSTMPAGATYHVTEDIDGVVTESDIVLPASPTTIDLSKIPRSTTTLPNYQYVPYEEWARYAFSALAPGLLADRGAATAYPAGTRYTATDDNGGTEYVTNGTSWLAAAPSVNSVGGKLLAQIAPNSVASVTCTAANTEYRITGLTTPSFTMPSKPVLVLFGLLRTKRSTGAATTARLSVKYTTNAWSSNTEIMTPVTHSSTDVIFTLNFYDWIIPAAIVNATPGATVQVAPFIQNTTAGAIMDIYAPVSGANILPHLSVISLGV